jgi:hypothetical protein
MGGRIIDDIIANQKIDIYLAVKDIVKKKKTVTMFGISRITKLSPSYIWTKFGLTGDLMRIINNAEEENKIRQRSNRRGMSTVKEKRKDKRATR